MSEDCECSESGQFVFVRVTVNNYESKVFALINRTSITERRFADTKVTLEPENVIYNGQSWNPEIKVVENWQGASRVKVNKAGLYNQILDILDRN